MKKSCIICLVCNIIIACSDGKGREDILIQYTPLIESIRYEAEEAILNENAVVGNTITDFSGSGYVDQNDGGIFFKITIPEKGIYKLDIRYTNGNLKKENFIAVNNTQFSVLPFQPTNNWKTLSINRVHLEKGDNTIQILKAWGQMSYDYIEISTTNKELADNIASKLVHPTPSAEAVKLYEFLKENYGKKTISAAMANYSTGLEEAEWLHETTGKWVAMAGFDFIDYNRTWEWVDYNAVVNNAKLWWTNNGITTIMWHWRDPLKINDQFYTESTTFDISKINDTNSIEYKAMIADIDIMAGYLKQLQDAKIPILWRPLHEAAGGWFWWGSKGAEPCKALWILMYDRLVNHHKLNNLIWVWTSDISEDAINWYPGDEYVDIIGMDIYPGKNRHQSQYIAFDKVKEIYAQRKIVALSECGAIPSIDNMFEYGDTWSWFMPWNGPMLRSDEHNGAEFMKKTMLNAKVITRDQMPNLK